MTKRRIIDDNLYAHFITFSCHKRRRLLDHDHTKRIVLGVLNKQLERQTARCAGFVVMPDHVHAIVWFPETRQLSRFMHGWKRISSYNIRRWLEDGKARYLEAINPSDPFWQPKYYSFEIYSRVKIEEKLTCMHQNPVRAGLVERPVDWKWSSARWYDRQQTVGVPIEWVD
ncbi:MAG: transposase [Planctomycetaceae bacterium]|nr:transposase [Planctomycetaceae bacterium]